MVAVCWLEKEAMSSLPSCVGVLISSYLPGEVFEPCGSWSSLHAQPEASVLALMCLAGLLVSSLLFAEAGQFESHVSIRVGGLLPPLVVQCGVLRYLLHIAWSV